MPTQSQHCLGAGFRNDARQLVRANMVVRFLSCTTRVALGKISGAASLRVGPAQPIDLVIEDCINSAVSLRQFKVQCSRVQGELLPCCVENDALTQRKPVPIVPKPALSSIEGFNRYAPFKSSKKLRLGRAFEDATPMNRSL
jgi:hypothetical protein